MKPGPAESWWRDCWRPLSRPRPASDGLRAGREAREGLRDGGGRDAAGSES